MKRSSRPLLDRYKPGTALTRYQDLQQFFKWCESEGEIDVSPMAKMTPPIMREVPVPVLGPVELGALLNTCKPDSADGAPAKFDKVRDAAILRLFIDTGMRAGELAALNVTDVDLDENVALVLGKGRRPVPARSVYAQPTPLTATTGHGAPTAAPVTTTRCGSPASDR